MAADTYTSILGLILQGTGNNDNTWGENLNNFAIQYIEDAIAGASAFTVTSGDVTLSDAQARSMILNVSGTLTGNRNIIVPNKTKRWIVKNGTSGAYTLGIKTSSGSAITLPQGGWCEVWCDGSNGVYMSPSTIRHYAQTDGTAALPYYSFASDVDSGIYLIGANNIGVGVNGAKVLDISTAGLNVTGDIDVTGLVKQNSVTVVPIGATFEYDGLTCPSGYLFKYGQAVSRTTYSALFDKITATATATRNGTTTLSSVSIDFSALGVVGAYIEGTGISLGTYITAVSATTITLSAAAFGSGSMTIRILPHGQGDGSTTFNIPDDRGRVKAGRDNMGGSAASRLTSGWLGMIATALGAFGGQENHTLTSAQSGQKAISAAPVDINDPTHQHTYTAPSGSNSLNANDPNSHAVAGAVGTSTSFAATGITATFTLAGSDAVSAHTNVQPTRITNFIIFTGVFS